MLEELGKYHLEKGSYQPAYHCFQECYEIRKRILRKSTCDEIQRVSCLLVYLHKQLEVELRQREERLRDQPTAGARLVTLGEKLGGLKRDEHQEEEAEVGAGSSLASKVMQDLFKRQKAQATEAELRKQREAEEAQKQRQAQHDLEFEKAVLNFVKTSAGQKMPESQPTPERSKANGFTALVGQGLKQNLLGQFRQVAAK